MSKSSIVFLASVFFFNTIVIAQSLVQKFCNLPCAEKRWVVFHPFVAKRAMRISERVRLISDSLLKVPLLDGDGNGGQVDALRHSLWMAMLCHEMRWGKALKLGKAHEQANRRQFRKGIAEHGILPDKSSVEMDLFNNNIGIKIAKEFGKSTGEADLISIISQWVIAGKMAVIKKDKTGNSLDEQGNLIPFSNWHGKWENTRCIVKSNFIRP